jgi:L-threonylcarbamoyladenylate synthase
VADVIEEAATAALAGLLVVLPTDTVYGIGTRPDEPASTRRIFDAKGRPHDLDLPVLVPSIEAATKIGELDDPARDLVARFWPGALTAVVRRTDRSRTWELGGRGETIGIRMPSHPVALAVLERTGPLAVTSANRSGEPTPVTCAEVEKVFGAAVAVYVCDETPLEGSPSTVVDTTADPPSVLRAGREALDIERWLAKNPELDTQNGTM